MQPNKKIKVRYKAEGFLNTSRFLIRRVLGKKLLTQKPTWEASHRKADCRNSGIKETIELSVEIDPNKDSYPDTLEFLRSRVLENLDEETTNRHDKLQEEFGESARELLEITKKLESAHKQWGLVSGFLRSQGLKTDTAEFPQEALNSLSKSLPTDAAPRAQIVVLRDD